MANAHRMTAHIQYLTVWTIAVAMLLCSPFSSEAADPADSPRPKSAASQESTRQFLEDAISSERANLAEMEQNLKRWEALRQRVTEEIENYRIQNAAHGNLLLVMQTRVEELQAALNDNRLLIKSLSERIVEFEKIGGIASERMAQLRNRIDIAERQKRDLQHENLPGTEKADLIAKLDSFLAILRDKEKQGEAFLSAYKTLFEQLNRLMDDLKETRRQLESRLQLQMRSNLFERNLQPFERLQPRILMSELTAVRNLAADLVSTAFWRRQWSSFQRTGAATQTLFLALFALTLIFRRKIRRSVQSVEARLVEPEWRMRRLALLLFRRSFELICAAVLLWLYDLLKLPHMNYSFGRFLGQMVFVLLFARWGIDYVRERLDESATPFQAAVRRQLIRFFQTVRVIVIAYLALAAVLGSDSLVVWILRLLLEAALVVRVVRFWRGVPPMAETEAIPEENRSSGVRWRVVSGVSYLVAGGALVLELIGYDALALHWLVSWAQTLLLALWAQIGWLSIQEWNATQKAAAKTQDPEEVTIIAAPLGWFIVQMARLLWLAAALIGALLVWSSSDAMMKTLQRLVNFEFPLGSLRFSLTGILLGVIILCVTHMGTRIGRRLLREKILDSRNFDRGLKDSIITISSYILWGLGILMALGVLGVNATSLAVVFGALSIGIGFGLQNIFNNFISGLILLFERPIQVGDYVEVNGLWAEVRKINVRSTIVQTFDNATVIIPNSDFISQQVTNWSFKDPRMRRTVDVGVAYGSDIERVRATLLDIAAHTANVLKYPQPDVLFLDHGDSALIFRLRFWTHVDNYYSTTTAIRFELDRQFREAGIEIAFPQRDLHIRSVCPECLTGGTKGPAADTGPREPATDDPT